jgi:hypothetical protein
MPIRFDSWSFSSNGFTPVNRLPVTSVYRTPPVAFAVSPTAWSAFPGPFLFRNVDRVTVPNFAPTDVESPNCTNRFFVVVGVPAAVAGPNSELSMRTRLYWPTHLTISPPATARTGR